MKPTYTELLEAVEEIAALIYYQSSLNDQDRWLEDIIVRDIWKIPTGHIGATETNEEV